MSGYRGEAQPSPRLSQVRPGQPGIWLVRAAAMSRLLKARPRSDLTRSRSRSPPSIRPTMGPPRARTRTGRDGDGESDPVSDGITRVRIALDKVPGSKMREVLRAAIVPLGANGADVAVSLVVEANAGGGTVPKETLVPSQQPRLCEAET